MILSIHIPKTAGVSIRNTLKEHFGPGFVLHYWTITDAWGRRLAEVPPTAECVHGHFHPDLLTGRFPSAQLFTWVRDPVERVASSYHHRLRAPDWQHPVCHELHRRRLSLAEYSSLPLVRNEMTRFFGSKSPDDFAFIGIVERYEESFRQLSSMLGLHPAPLRRDNVNPDRTSAHYVIDPGVRREIERYNEADAKLYRECLARADRKSGREAADSRADGSNGRMVSPVDCQNESGARGKRARSPE